jgi:hypothetical protein
MICAFCKSDIEDDSIYCDQCGKEILICPKCGKPGKGKVCTFDGTALVSVRDKGSNTKQPLSTDGNVPLISPSMVNPASALLVNPSVSPTINANDLHLINKNLGLDLKIENGDIIGRTTGRFANVFGKYDQVSGKHLQISYDPKNGWMGTDLGSTNGTKYNNVLLTPNLPQKLEDKSYLIIANIEFYIRIENKSLSGKTGTRRI